MAKTAKMDKMKKLDKMDKFGETAVPKARAGSAPALNRPPLLQSLSTFQHEYVGILPATLPMGFSRSGPYNWLDFLTGLQSTDLLSQLY